MKRPASVALALLALLSTPTFARADGLNVEVWTNRGDEAVYREGDLLKIGVRANRDAHLLVYEIDAEGYVNLLFPYQRANDYVEAGQTYRIPDDDADVELVVEGPTGQGYIVAVASSDPFQPLPWYLRPYSAQAAALGYEGEAEDEEGVTTEGRITGDPFVAMERIRRRVVGAHENPDAFATAYTTYYLHEPVKYPRYLCYDCHRPGYWSWWSGFDPYYTTCSVFTFRVNYSWYWGPGYWFGHVPYYVYHCRPGYGWKGRYWYSGWDGWSYWSSVWGGPLRRYKSPPPPGYIPPDKYKDGTPPGLIAARDFRRGGNMTLPIGRNERARDDDSRGDTRIERGERGTQRQPAGEVRRDDGTRRPGEQRGGIQRRPASERPRGDDGAQRPERPAPRREPQGQPRQEPAREPEGQPRQEPAREPQPAPPVPAPAPPAPKPRDEARPVPSRGGSRGGERGGQIGATEPQRNVQRGRLSYAGERDRGRAIEGVGRGAAARDGNSAPRQIERRAPRYTPRGEMQMQRTTPAPRSEMQMQRRAPAPRSETQMQRRTPAPAPRLQKSATRAAQPAPRVQKSEPRAQRAPDRVHKAEPRGGQAGRGSGRGGRDGR